MTIRTLCDDFLEYYPTTGKLFWKKSPGNRCPRGTEAGSIDSSGQRQIKFKGKTYQASHLIWFIVHNYMPKEIDHKDRNPDNNILTNLREVTHQQNCLNRDRKLPSSGFRGVYAKGRKWEAKVTHQGQTERLGTFETPELASKAYETRARQLHEEYFPDD